MKRLEKSRPTRNTKKGRIKNRILYFTLFLILILILFYFFKDSKYLSPIQKFVQRSPTIAADSLRDSESEDDTIGISNVSSDFFKFKTKYDTLAEQEIIQDSAQIELVSQTKLGNDSLGTIVQLDEPVDSTAINSEQLIPANSIDDNIPFETTHIEKSKRANSETYDLFDELLVAGSSQDKSELRTAINNKKDSFARKSTLKILSICSKNILLNINKEDNEEILLSLADAETISSLQISDRNGQIIFSTANKLLNRQLSKVYPEITNEQQGLDCLESDLNEVCSLPIFHTYGKIGFGIIVYSE